MNFKDFKHKYRDYPVIRSSYFSLEKRPAYLRRLVSEWCKKGWLIQLRRGVYLPNEQEVLQKTERLSIANQIYEPSYVSLESALSFYGMIPEGVYAVVSISTRKTMRFNNTFGQFIYHHIKPGLFWGAELHSLGSQSVLIADREKALLDLLYLRRGEFMSAEQVIESLRLEHVDRLRIKMLRAYGSKFKLKHLTQIIDQFCARIKTKQSEP